LIRFKSGRLHIIVHIQIKILFDLLQSPGWCSASLLHLLLDAVVNCTIDALVLYIVVEAFFVSFVSEVGLNFCSLRLKVTLSYMGESWVLLCLFAADCLVKGGESCMFIINQVNLRLKIGSFGGRTSDTFSLLA
jgi:hypothetical protein